MISWVYGVSNIAFVIVQLLNGKYLGGYFLQDIIHVPIRKYAEIQNSRIKKVYWKELLSVLVITR